MLRVGWCMLTELAARDLAVKPALDVHTARQECALLREARLDEVVGSREARSCGCGGEERRRDDDKVAQVGVHRGFMAWK